MVARMRRAGDGVLADQTIGQVQVHMRAGFKGRQLRADRLQPDRPLAMSLVDDFRHTHLMQAHAVILAGQRRKKSL